MALADRKPDATEDRLAAMTLPDGGCIMPTREAALARLRDMGLPNRRDEYWKYTRPDTLVQAEALPAALFDAGEAPMFSQFDRLKIVFVDGVFDPEASDDLTMEGVRIDRIADICCKDIHWAKDLYGVLETRGQTPVARPLAALNTAFAQDGVAIHITGKPSKPISLIYFHRSETSDAILHHVIRVEPGAEATILENGPAAARLRRGLRQRLGHCSLQHWFELDPERPLHPVHRVFQLVDAGAQRGPVGSRLLFGPCAEAFVQGGEHLCDALVQRHQVGLRRQRRRVRPALAQGIGDLRQHRGAQPRRLHRLVLGVPGLRSGGGLGLRFGVRPGVRVRPRLRGCGGAVGRGRRALEGRVERQSVHDALPSEACQVSRCAISARPADCSLASTRLA